jgi:hypothetical protein
VVSVFKSLVVLYCLSGLFSPAAVFCETQESRAVREADSLLTWLLERPETHMKEIAPAESLFHRNLAKHPEIFFIIRTNSKGIIVNAVARNGDSTFQPGMDVSNKKWHNVPQKTLKRFHASMQAAGNGRASVVGSTPIIVKNSTGVFRFGGALVVRIFPTVAATAMSTMKKEKPHTLGANTLTNLTAQKTKQKVSASSADSSPLFLASRSDTFQDSTVQKAEKKDTAVSLAAAQTPNADSLATVIVEKETSAVSPSTASPTINVVEKETFATLPSAASPTIASIERKAAPVSPSNVSPPIAVIKKETDSGANLSTKRIEKEITLTPQSVTTVTTTENKNEDTSASQSNANPATATIKKDVTLPLQTAAFHWAPWVLLIFFVMVVAIILFMIALRRKKKIQPSANENCKGLEASIRESGIPITKSQAVCKPLDITIQTEQKMDSTFPSKKMEASDQPELIKDESNALKDESEKPTFVILSNPQSSGVGTADTAEAHSSSINATLSTSNKALANSLTGYENGESQLSGGGNRAKIALDVKNEIEEKEMNSIRMATVADLKTDIRQNL